MINLWHAQQLGIVVQLLIVADLVSLLPRSLQEYKELLALLLLVLQRHDIDQELLVHPRVVNLRQQRIHPRIEIVTRHRHQVPIALQQLRIDAFQHLLLPKQFELPLH